MASCSEEGDSKAKEERRECQGVEWVVVSRY